MTVESHEEILTVRGVKLDVTWDSGIDDEDDYFVEFGAKYHGQGFALSNTFWDLGDEDREWYRKLMPDGHEGNLTTDEAVRLSALEYVLTFKGWYFEGTGWVPVVQ